jgi:hypothetical protein
MALRTAHADIKCAATTMFGMSWLIAENKGAKRGFLQEFGNGPAQDAVALIAHEKFVAMQRMASARAAALASDHQHIAVADGHCSVKKMQEAHTRSVPRQAMEIEACVGFDLAPEQAARKTTVEIGKCGRCMVIYACAGHDGGPRLREWHSQFCGWQMMPCAQWRDIASDIIPQNVVG